MHKPLRGHRTDWAKIKTDTPLCMTSLNDEQLLQYGERSNGRVVLVTGSCQNTDGLKSLTVIKNYALSIRCRIWNRKRDCVDVRPFQVSSPNVYQTCIGGHRKASRAKLVLGDLNAAGIDEVITQIKKSGGCVAVICPKLSVEHERLKQRSCRPAV